MYKNFFKRVFDLILSIIALPFVLLLIAIVAPFVWFEDQGLYFTMLIESVKVVIPLKC